MSGFTALDVAIGLSFVYLLLALVCSAVNEAIAGALKTRAKVLEQGVTRMLGDPQVKRQVYEHPLIKALSLSDDEIRPSYIDSRKFALALMDVTGLHAEEEHRVMVAERRAVGEAPAAPPVGNATFQKTLQTVLKDRTYGPSSLGAAGYAGSDQQRIEAWFDSQMDRVSGWYKRKTQFRITALAVLVTLALNADTITIIEKLWTDPTVRAAIVEQARVRAQKEPPQDLPLVEYPDTNRPDYSVPVQPPSSNALTSEEQKSLGELMGWGDELHKPQDQAYGLWLEDLLWTQATHLPGWILTIMAISLGAPFWFDVLNRFMNIRNAGRAPDEPRDKSTGSTR
jgi:hypothetical protein